MSGGPSESYQNDGVTVSFVRAAVEASEFSNGLYGHNQTPVTSTEAEGRASGNHYSTIGFFFLLELELCCLLAATTTETNQPASQLASIVVVVVVLVGWVSATP